MRHVAEVFRQPGRRAPARQPDGRLAPDEGGGQFDAGRQRARRSAAGSTSTGSPPGSAPTTLPGASALYVPLTRLARPAWACSGSGPPTRHAMDAPEQLHQLETFAEPDRAGARAGPARRGGAAGRRCAIETERLRNSLLSSVSHDLRTPLAAITGAASTILENGRRASTPHPPRAAGVRARRGRAAEPAGAEPPRDDAPGVGRAAAPHASWHPPEEVIGAALGRLASALARPARHHPRAARPAAGPDGRRADRAGADQPPRQRAQVHAGRAARSR